jgi:predicted nucleotidyltransferase component of viral defense system
MIRPGEIQQVARKASVRDTQIEKDYILSWILYGMSKHDRLSKILAFKGGTALKKVYFEEYRYSEDLDFTLLEDGISNEQIFADYREVFDWVKREANITLQLANDAEHESGSINFYIAYGGPLGGGRLNNKVKVDITRKEIMEFPPILKPVFIHYSDLKGFDVLCYPLEEILIEKMCALMGRTQPRDLYDFWYLVEFDKMDITHSWPEFERKAKNKGHLPSAFKEKIQAKMKSFKGRWQGSLSSQIRDLPDFELVVREVNKHLRKISPSGL